MQLRLLTWSLQAAGSPPGSPAEVASALDRCDCDLAVLAEVGGDWPAVIARETGAEYRQLPPRGRGRWRLGARLGRARGGSTAAVLARRDRLIDDRLEPLGRARVLGVRLACGPWVVVLDPGRRAAPAAVEATAAARAALYWAQDDAAVLVLGSPDGPPALEGFRHVAGGEGVQVLLAGALKPRPAPPAPAGALVIDLRLAAP